MATTRTESKQRKNGSRTRSGKSSESQRSGSGMFNFGDNQAGAIAAAAVAGAAVGLAANLGRKLFMQGMTAAAGSWDEALAAEHKAVLAIFDKLEQTKDSQTTIRAHLLMKMKHALAKHALQEENVIYPALRQANAAHDADTLNSEHGYVKTYLYELENMPKDSPEWLARLRDFRAMIQEHMSMEEDRVFPELRSTMSEDQNAKLTMMMNKEGLKLA